MYLKITEGKTLYCYQYKSTINSLQKQKKVSIDNFKTQIGA